MAEPIAQHGPTLSTASHQGITRSTTVPPSPVWCSVTVHWGALGAPLIGVMMHGSPLVGVNVPVRVVAPDAWSARMSRPPPSGEAADPPQAPVPAINQNASNARLTPAHIGPFGEG